LKIVKWLDKNFEVALLSVALIVMVSTMSVQIFARKILGTSLSWPEELNRYLFIWSGFLSVSLTIHNNTVMKMDIIANLLQKRLLNYVYFFANLLMIIFFLYVSKVAMNVFVGMGQMSATLNISMKWVYFSAILGFLLTVMRLVQNNILIVKKIRKGAGK
jgi:TRAP-type C4-dicarboxylate transport system permease small subunit